LEEDNEITLEETIVVQDRLIQKYERQIKGLEQKISSFEQENKKLTEKLDEYKTSTEDKDIDTAVTFEKQTENIDRMNTKANQLITEVERKNGEIHQLELKNKEISESIFSKEKQIGSLEERINHLTQDLDLKKQENQTLQEEIKKAQAENIRISNEVARLSGNLEGQKTRNKIGRAHV
jgi:chromosome segregation ATPase